MSIKCLLAALLVGAAALSGAGPASAKLVRFEVRQIISPAFEGRKFGTVGTYDRLVGRAVLAVDPAEPHNRPVVDLDLAPRDAAGTVALAVDVEILRPTDPAKANGGLLYDVVNRGRKLALILMNEGPDTSEPAKASDAGNGFLMEQGWTVVWSAWQGDAPPGAGRLVLAPPLVPGVTGLSREEFVFDDATNPATAALSYPAATLDPAAARLSVRARADDPRKTPPGLRVAFDGPSKITIQRPAGYDDGAIYELIYKAKDPTVMGLGFVATRDVVAFLRRDGGAWNPLAAGGVAPIRYAVGLGISQSGRFLRDLLYQGFNEDEAGRPVFDGLMIHIAGSRRSFVNARFAQPGRFSRQHDDNVFPGDQFPFTYPVLHDPVSGRTDGILAACQARANCPKIFHSDSGTEVVQARISLVVGDTLGRPIDLPDNVRAFLLADLPHFSASNARPAIDPVCQFPTNPLHAGAPMRALLVAMQAWVTEGTKPPDSRYPSLRDGSLVKPDALRFPKIPGFHYAGALNYPSLVDHGVMPPVKRKPYPLFVPQVDADGHDVAGIRLPAIDAPVATYLGWNLRRAGFAEGDLCGLKGSMLALPATAQDAKENADGRRSLAERYPTLETYRQAVAQSAARLVAARLLLPDDAPRLEQAALLLFQTMAAR
jgi:hypothetical protein